MAGVDATIIPLDVIPVVVIGNAITPIAACALFVYQRFHFFTVLNLHVTSQTSLRKSSLNLFISLLLTLNGLIPLRVFS